MIPIRVAINGLGRIGRALLRCAWDDVQFVAINDLADATTLAHLVRYDSVHRIAPFKIEAENDVLRINGQSVSIFRERDPALLPWKAMEVDIVVESTGKFVDRASALRHLEAGAKKVIISAPAKNPDITVVLGVNGKQYDPRRHHIISNASCTTNCLAPVVWVLLQTFGVERGLMTTVHSYTNDQNILDLPHNDLRRARAAALSMIPTTTGAARALSEVLPELAGKMDGISVRVPTPNVSLVDLVVTLPSEATGSDLCEAYRRFAEGPLAGILQYTEEPLVSVDFTGNPHSAIVDGTMMRMIDQKMVKILAWYDNEWGYASRVRDLLLHIGKNLEGR